MGNAQVGITNKKHLVIIGCSYAGYEILKQVDQFFKVTVIDKTDYFENFIYYFKEYETPDHFNSSILEYKNVKVDSNTTFIKGTVVKVSKDKKVSYLDAEGGIQNLGFDYLVIASGSTQPSPHKDFDVKNSDERKQRIQAEV